MFFTVCVHSVLVLMRRTIEIELNGFWNNYHPRWFLLKSFSVQCSKIEPENVEIFFPYLQFTLNSITVAVGNKEGWEESLVVLQYWGHYKECGMSLTNNHNYAEKNANKWVRNYFFSLLLLSFIQPWYLRRDYVLTKFSLLKVFFVKMQCTEK